MFYHRRGAPSSQAFYCARAKHEGWVTEEKTWDSEGESHAGINYRRKQGWTNEDIMTHANMSARTYVLHYMRNVRRTALTG